MAWKLDRKYSKRQILEFYLNSVPFGRGAYGVEAAAQAFFGKTANYVRGGMVKLHYVTGAQADQLRYPDTVIDYNPNAYRSGLDRPTGIAVDHVPSELRQSDAFRRKPKDYIANGVLRRRGRPARVRPSRQELSIRTYFGLSGSSALRG